MRFGLVGLDRWPDARSFILPALARSRDFAEADVTEALAKGQANLWIGEDEAIRCAVVTRVHKTARGRVCEIWLMGGKDRADWLHFIDEIEAMARANGCVAMEIVGRPGWRRVLPDYRLSAVVIEKVL